MELTGGIARAWGTTRSRGSFNPLLHASRGSNLIKYDDRESSERLIPSKESPVLIIEDPFARSPRARYTIGRLMIVIAVVAFILALPTGLALATIPLFIPVGAVGISRWLFRGRRLRLAAYIFWGLAIPINLATAYSCITPNPYVLRPIFLALLVVGLPTITALGTVWGVLFARRQSVSPRTRDGAGLAVVFMVISPIVTLWSFWPLYLAFMVARPAMARLADQVAAGETVEFPRRVGLFTVTTATVDPVSGNARLMLDPDPNSSARFVRTRRGSALTPSRPIAGSDLDVDLGGGWSYHKDE